VTDHRCERLVHMLFCNTVKLKGNGDSFWCTFVHEQESQPFIVDLK